MRTSRISRETTRVVDTLSSPNLLRNRRPLRNNTRSKATSSSTSTQLEQSDSDLSTPPSSPDTTSSVSSSHLGKRKRGSAKPNSDARRLPDATPARRSPRKVPANDDTAPRTKPQRKPSKRIKRDDGSTEVTPPTNWQETYDVTAAMRRRLRAPVDTMGCETLAERTRSPRDQRLQTLVSLMLSSQTKDTVTAAAMRNLQTGLPGGFDLAALLAVAPADLNEMIGKVGFHNNKTKFIKSVAEILRDRFDGDIPDTIDGLVSLPGVGPKMAYLCMSAAWGRDEGIGVDVHVHRITNLWKWHKTSTPEQTRAELEAWLPKEKWHEINHLLVGLGQTICLPVGRKCGECDLSARKLCPSAVPGNAGKKKVKNEVETKVEGGEVVKQEAALETDDTGYAVNIKNEDMGEINVSGVLSQVPDIEGLGAGTVRRLSSLAENGR